MHSNNMDTIRSSASSALGDAIDAVVSVSTAVYNAAKAALAALLRALFDIAVDNESACDDEPVRLEETNLNATSSDSDDATETETAQAQEVEPTSASTTETTLALPRATRWTAQAPPRFEVDKSDSLALDYWHALCHRVQNTDLTPTQVDAVWGMILTLHQFNDTKPFDLGVSDNAAALVGVVYNTLCHFQFDSERSCKFLLIHWFGRYMTFHVEAIPNEEESLALQTSLRNAYATPVDTVA